MWVFFEDTNALVRDKVIRHNSACVSELFTKFNEMNLQLKGIEVFKANGLVLGYKD